MWLDLPLMKKEFSTATNCTPCGVGYEITLPFGVGGIIKRKTPWVLKDFSLVAMGV